MNQVPVKRITLCCIDTRDPESALVAFRHCLDQCAFEKVLFFTDRPIHEEGIQTVRLATLKSRAEYSRFIIKDLYRYLETDFVLIIQYDGFILDGSRWRDEFLEYDYVGARWLGNDGANVGNGGFSLRSKRLLEALQDGHLAGLHPEDVAICVTYRPLLERKYGIKFAPGAVADLFSWERMLPAHADGFGFHDRGHPPRQFDPHHCPADFQAVARRLTGKYFIYQRIGYDDRPIGFLEDGTVKLARAVHEQTWALTRVGRDVLLTISSDREMTVELKEYPDQVWRGRWLTFEKMPVALYPSGS